MTFPHMPETARRQSGDPASQSAHPAHLTVNAMTQAIQTGAATLSNGLMGYEACMTYSRNAGVLGLEWCSELMKCATPIDAVNVNARFIGRYWSLWRSMSHEVCNDAVLFTPPSDNALVEKAEETDVPPQRLYG